MKRKGFTLVELLAVIVILAVISIITIPMIGNVIKDSKKKALEQSVYGLVEAANYFAIANEGRYGFLFNETSKGETKDRQYALDYKGEIDAKGELYIDSNGDISLCLENEDYYVYKNYNSGIYVGNISEDSCELKFDPLTNKYIAYLESEGEGINVYTKEEVNNLIDSVNTNVTSNTNEITSIKENITNLQTDISNYALNSDLNSLSSIVNINTTDINNINDNLTKIEKDGNWIVYKFYDGNFIATMSWSSGNEISMTTAYGNIYISPRLEISLPQNIETVTKIIGNSTYLGGSVGGVSISDNRNNISLKTNISFYFWSAISFTSTTSAQFMCFGSWK